MPVSVTLVLPIRLLCGLLYPSKATDKTKTLFFCNYAAKFQDFQACLVLEDRIGNSEETFFSTTASVGAGNLFVNQAS